VTRDPLLTDVGIAVLAAIVILVLTPGVAVAGMIALLVLLIFVTRLVLDSRRERAQASRPRRQRPATSPGRRQRPRTSRPSPPASRQRRQRPRSW
jgi:hypothetical protein